MLSFCCSRVEAVRLWSNMDSGRDPDLVRLPQITTAKVTALMNSFCSAGAQCLPSWRASELVTKTCKPELLAASGLIRRSTEQELGTGDDHCNMTACYRDRAKEKRKPQYECLHVEQNKEEQAAIMY